MNKFDFNNVNLKIQILKIVVLLICLYTIDLRSQKLNHEYYKKIDSLRNKIENSKGDSLVISNYNLSTTFKKSNLDSAFYYVNQALKLSYKYDNLEYKIKTHQWLGELYYFSENYKKAMDHFQIESELITQSRDSSQYAYVSGIIGDVYFRKGNSNKALENFKSALDFLEIYKDDFLEAWTYLRLVELYINLSLLDQASTNLKIGQDIAKKINNEPLIAWFEFNKAKILIAKNDYNGAIYLLNKILSQNIFTGVDFIDFRISCLNVLSNCFYLQNDYEKALRFAYRAFNLYTDKANIYNRKKIETLLLLGKINRQIKKTEKAKDYLRQGLDLAIDNSRYQIIPEYNLELYYLAKENNDNNLALYYLEENMMLDKLFRDDNMSDLVLELNAKTKLKESFAQFEKSKKEFKETTNRLVEQLKFTKLEKNLLVLIFTTFLIILSLFYYYLNNKKKKNIILHKLKALHSQMNPHFIFNSINGIQQHILQQDRITAYKHLNQFSNLIRSVLARSNEDYITINEEIEFLQSYVALEKLRFGDRLHFHFNINSDLDLSQFIIPSFIVQPLLENAIIHGIDNKVEGGCIKINIETSIDTVKIEISDNGVGRRKSRNLKTNKKNNSLATKNLKQRLDLLKEVSFKKTSMEIIDLENDRGTIINLIFPLVRSVNHNPEYANNSTA